METLTFEDFMRLRKLVHRGARPIDYARWRLLLEGGDPEEYLSVLSSYQNGDGGFGHNIECNNWNPDSAPYTVCIALDYLDAVGDHAGAVKDAMVGGILRYLASGAHTVGDGWVGMQGVPTNDGHSHLPWFHYDPGKASAADVGVTKRLSSFILRYGEAGSDLRRRAGELEALHGASGKVLLNGVPDYDLSSFDPATYDPAGWPFWMPKPAYYVGSPDSGRYPAFKEAVDKDLEAIVVTLRGTAGLHIAPEAEIEAWERANPHPDGKRWGGYEQTIGNYYWNAHGIVSNMGILKAFGRLGFAVPVGPEALLGG
ncbi:MAG: hypothetical protein FWE70_06905 [Oscillospiraceae bacterium]|nr:hypothetical protein [Oscillospiraceae bacterium]